ncbi:MAG: hypothetical protein HY321_21750 [Armatimonadetes bacterium]|nr:hypothetical protein [Armatimonadota bacterium]
MTTRERVLDLVERTDDEDLAAVVPILERLARPLTPSELQAMADAAPPDDEPSSEAELEGEAAYQAWLRGEIQAVPDKEVRGYPHQGAA